MKRNDPRIFTGLFAVVLTTLLAALGFGGCVHEADDCRNTLTCIPDGGEGGGDGGSDAQTD